MLDLKGMRIWALILILALGPLLYASQKETQKKTNEEEIAALKKRVSDLEQAVIALKESLETLGEPKFFPAR